ncbi:hypothetical protein [Rhodococcus daqingensis]|uniref:Uncharacterized protein n=1 Tax=Rhodococcus daqingensis TaxID=2479363 RepID=A0ABW2S1T7_9NOCA
MDRSIVDEFFDIECDEYTRKLLLDLLAQIGPGTVRELTFDVFNVTINGSDRTVDIEDELDPDRSTQITIDQLREVLAGHE